MKYRTEKYILDETGNQIYVGAIVTVKYLSGGGSGGCRITKVTEKGFRFTQDGKREKTVSYDNLAQIEIQHNSRRPVGMQDISGQNVCEGDIIESHMAGKVIYPNLVVKYGTYEAYCPVDKCYMESVGFYVSGKGLPDMPVGPLKDYAKVIGNVYDNPELLDD